MRAGKAEVSIIIPAKNRADLLRVAIDSVLRQNILSQIIVVDDGSEIALREQLPKKIISKINLVRNAQSIGPAAARNRALKLVKGRYLAFLDSDDWWEPNFLIGLVNNLKKHPRWAGVMCLSHRRYLGDWSLGARIGLTLYNLLKDFLLLVAYIFNSRQIPQTAPFLGQISHLVFDREKIRGIHFDSRFKYGEDWVFLLAILKKGAIGINLHRLTNLSYTSSSNTFTQARINSGEKSGYYQRVIKKVKKNFGSSLHLWMFEVYTKLFLIRSWQ